MMGLAFGVGVALLLGLFDRSIRNPVEVVEQMGVRVLGSVEHIPVEAFISSGLDRRLIEPIRGISTTLLASSPKQNGHSRLITSPTAGSGKSSMSMNLARSLAATGRRVLLIDADNQGQGATRRLNLAGCRGLPDFLDGVPAQELTHTVARNLDVLPSGIQSESFGDSLRAKSALDRLRDLYQNYEEVIIDSPPLLVKSDAIALATMADEVVLVIRAGRTTHEEAQLARQYLESVGGNVVGVILNAVDPKTARYGYGYGYTYANNGKSL
jgi:capsular exopolysaccharide synthesis family protein